MAYIPKKDRVSVFEAGKKGAEFLIFIFILLILAKQIGDFVYPAFQPVIFVLLILCGAYLLFPSRRNEGCNGFESLVIMFTYYVRKMQFNIAKKGVRK